MQEQPNKLYTYLSSKQITSSQQLPVPFTQRAPTDIFCTIITSIFALTMFIIACISFNLQKLRYITYPTDNMGRKCTLDSPQYNYLYFTTLNDVTKRICVSKCPSGTQTKLQCLPTDDLSCSKNSNPNFQVDIYSTIGQQTSIGLYCFPSDQTAKQQLLKNTNLQEKLNFVKSYRSIWISAGVSFGLGFIFLLLNCVMTRAMVYITVAIGGLCFLGFGVLFIIWNVNEFHFYSPFVILLCVVMLFFGIMLMTSLCFRRNDLSQCGDYLEKGVKVLRKQIVLVFMIPLFLILTFGLIALCLYQLLAYWSSSQLQFNKSQIYYSAQGTFASVMEILDLIEFLWGLCFLKEVYNFIVAACAVTYSYKGDSLIMNGVKALFKFHWGSVVGSSFLLNFFFLPDLIYSFIKGIFGCKCCSNACSPIDRLFGFARSQTMAFINAVGLPYCNSSRWCQRIHHLTHFFDSSQSIFRYFSLGSHIMLASLATFIGFLYSTTSGIIPNQLAILFSVAVNTFVITYFVSLFKNLAESMLMCDLINRYLNGENLRPDLQQSQQNQPYVRPKTVLVNGGKDVYESNVHQGYEILPTHAA